MSTILSKKEMSEEDIKLQYITGVLNCSIDDILEIVPDSNS